MIRDVLKNVQCCLRSSSLAIRQREGASRLDGRRQLIKLLIALRGFDFKRAVPKLEADTTTRLDAAVVSNANIIERGLKSLVRPAKPEEFEVDCPSLYTMAGVILI